MSQEKTMQNALPQKSLPQAELDIMLVLWGSESPLRTAEILSLLDNGWTMATLKVLLGRLCERGYLQPLREGRLMQYRALVSEKSYRRRETRGLLDKFYQSSVKNLVAALAHDEGLTQTDLQELAAMLQNAQMDREEREHK
ncbi:MAG: BlaI/MecI/CopY family transcriptional regulator [Oscillospiraceae bacterium]|nr:BlaI/MecI/CopY family transcriptional regulator [Oscillospiraceae bacterium]